MSDQVVPGGRGWSVRPGRHDEVSAPPVESPAPAVPPGEAHAVAATPAAPSPDDTPIGAPGVMAAHADGKWIAGVGWVPADHPYATGAAKPPGHRPRRRGLVGIGPSGPFGRIGMRVGISATLGIVLFSLFGWHSWITDLFHGSHDVATPASIAGDPLVLSGPIVQLSQQVDAFMQTDPIVEKSAGGFYAPPGAAAPSYAVFGIKHRGASMTAGDMSDIVDHISGGKYDGTVQSTTNDGVTYTCGNVELGGRLGVACVWDDYNVGGFLVSFGDSDVPAVMALTQMARNAIEGTTSAPTPTAAPGR